MRATVASPARIAARLTRIRSIVACCSITPSGGVVGAAPSFEILAGFAELPPVPTRPGFEGGLGVVVVKVVHTSSRESFWSDDAVRPQKLLRLDEPLREPLRSVAHPLPLQLQEGPIHQGCATPKCQEHPVFSRQAATVSHCHLWKTCQGWCTYAAEVRMAASGVHSTYGLHERSWLPDVSRCTRPS